jgi:acyl dehydratase
VTGTPETRERDSAPGLIPSYAKAVLGALVPGGSDELPDHGIALKAVEIDAERVAEYSRVCGFGVRDAVPPTYPHVLGFPLAMSLMTERAFPFALLGLVHVGNRIEQRRAIATTDRPDLCIWAENLRPHRRGRQLDLVTEAKLDGEVVWLEHTTYLRRGKTEGEEGEPGAEEREAPEVPSDGGALWDLPGDIGRRYADVSGDSNPLHLHPLSARLFGFPRAIAHGMWTKAHAIAAFEGRIPESHVVEVEFRSPLLVPGRARLRTGAREGGWAFTLEDPDGERMHLTGSIAPL